MPTPKEGYFLKDGTRVPGTTTIIGKFKEAGGLMYWSWDIAFQGILKARAVIEHGKAADRKKFLKIPLDTWDFRAQRDKAADAGTCVHDQVECFIRKRKFDAAPYTPEMLNTAAPAFEAFMEWAQGSKLTPAETETRLVSESLKFGGTLDAMLISGKLAIGDWKTSKDVYGSMLIQLAAYGYLWNEAHPDRPIDGGYHLLRFSKQAKPSDPITFTHKYWSQLDEALEAFKHMRELYEIGKSLDKLAK